MLKGSSKSVKPVELSRKFTSYSLINIQVQAAAAGPVNIDYNADYMSSDDAAEESQGAADGRLKHGGTDGHNIENQPLIMTHVAGHAGLKYTRATTLSRWEDNELQRVQRDYPDLYQKHISRLKSQWEKSN